MVLGSLSSVVLFGEVREVDVPDCRLGQVRQFPGLVAVGDFFGFWCHVCIGSCVLEAWMMHTLVNVSTWVSL